MVFNPLWGVGKEPKALRTPSITRLVDGSLDLNAGASPSPNTSSVTVPNGTQIVALSITLTPQDRSQGCTNGKLAITVDGNLISNYFTPTSQTAGVPPNWQVNEIIPFSYEVYNGATLSATLSADNGGTTGYIMQVDVSAIGFEF